MVRVSPIATIALLSALAISGLCPPALAGSGVQRVKLVPHFAPGQILHYQFDLRTNATSHSAGPIADPQGATDLEQSASATVRLEVLSVEGADADSPGRVRVRATFEKSAATSHSDALDPQETERDDQFRKLQGSSIEFTIEPDGRLTDVTGDMKEVFGNAAANGPGGLANLSPSASLPRQGISIGQKWSAERPLEPAPLAGLVWRTESTYLRDEPCRAAASAKPGNADATAQETCAVILTRFQIIQRNTHGEQTPDDYRRNGLRTSGKWSGEAESLSAISLRSGLITSVTQTGTETMDFTVANAAGDSRIHYAGQVRTQSEITLLPEAPR